MVPSRASSYLFIFDNWIFIATVKIMGVQQYLQIRIIPNREPLPAPKRSSPQTMSYPTKLFDVVGLRPAIRSRSSFLHPFSDTVYSKSHSTFTLNQQLLVPRKYSSSPSRSDRIRKSAVTASGTLYYDIARMTLSLSPWHLGSPLTPLGKHCRIRQFPIGAMLSLRYLSFSAIMMNMQS